MMVEHSYDEILTMITKFSAVEEKIKKDVTAELSVIGASTTKEIKNDMRKPKSGRFYVYRKRAHRASAPGESPAVMSGRLIGSVGYKANFFNRLEVGAGSNDIIYAKFLEKGTKRMRPRPYLANFFEENTKNMHETFSGIIRGAFKW